MLVRIFWFVGVFIPPLEPILLDSAHNSATEIILSRVILNLKELQELLLSLYDPQS